MSATTVPRHTRETNRSEEALRDVMSAGVIVIPEEASAAQVQRALVAHGVHAILVLEHDGRPVGWATTAGLMGVCDRDTALLSARYVVTEEAVTLEPSVTVREALEIMRARSVPRVLVSRPGCRLPEGVVAELDLLTVFAR